MENTLIGVLADLEQNPEQGLTDLRILAERWKLSEIGEWARKECAGYSPQDDLPAYRVWNARLVGDLCETWGGVVSKELDLREVIRSSGAAVTIATTHRCLRPVGWLWNESYGGRGPQETRIAVDRRLEELVTAEIGATIGPGPGHVTCVKAEHRFATSEFGSAAQGARQQGIDLCIECENQGLILPNPRVQEHDDQNGSPREKGKILQAVWEELKEHRWEIISLAAGLAGGIA